MRKNALTIASMFGCEEAVDGKLSAFDERIATLSAFAEGKTAIVGLATGGAYNVLGNDGRCSLIGKEIGFTNVGVDSEIDTSTHGNEASFEFIAQKNPEYVFCLDRDAAISTDGAAPAAELLNNELVNSTEAGKNGNVIVLANSGIWYTAEGGISALDLMLADLETALLG